MAVAGPELDDGEMPSASEALDALNSLKHQLEAELKASEERTAPARIRPYACVVRAGGAG